MPRRDRTPRRRLDASTRREAILAAAVEQFSTRRYDQVSVAGVAAAACASEALVYRYFPGKQALYRAAVDAALAGLLDRQLEATRALGPDADGPLRLETSLGVYFDWVAERATGWREQAAPGSGSMPAGSMPEVVSIRTRITEHYLAGLREAIDPPDSPGFDYALRGYLAFVDACVAAWVERGHPDADRQVMIDQSTAVLRAALRLAARAGAGAESGPRTGTETGNRTGTQTGNPTGTQTGNPTGTQTGNPTGTQTRACRDPR